jgi:FKBP-type peptidyl-prolyl cis-trans isomerase FkpA
MPAFRSILLTGALVAAVGCSKPPAPANPPGPPPTPAVAGGPDNAVLESTSFAPVLGLDLKAMTKSASGLYYRDLTVGSGAAAVAGQDLTVHYRGVLADGSVFDTGNYTFRLGGRTVIRGWDEGLVGMRVGGKRQLVVPPEMGYGVVGRPPVIPGDAVLVFTVDLLGIK